MWISGLIGSLLLIVVLACSETAPPTTKTTATPSTDAPATSAEVTTTSIASLPAPWATAPLSQADVPVLAAEWGQAENQSSCAALSPSGGIAGASPRAANFGGGWAVAWDAADGPGMESDGTFCENCGRSAVGVAGTGVDVDESVIRAWPNVIEWDDGSLGGYGVEGSLGESSVVDNALTGGVDSPTQLAYLSVSGQGCLYNVWSRRSEAELLDVINRLRFVEDLGAPSG